MSDNTKSEHSESTDRKVSDSCCYVVDPCCCQIDIFFLKGPGYTPDPFFISLNEGSGSFSPNPLNIAEWIIFFKIGCCPSGLGIVRKNRHTPKLYL